MSTYFETHPQKIRGGQWSRVRRNGAKPSGVVVVHTAESATDFLGPDPGAEAVARYFCNADRYASYHHISDSDSGIQLAPWSAETWHDTGTNNHSVGISAAIQCQHWDKLADRGEKIVKRMAAAAANYAKWLKKYYGITIPARKITRAQSRNRVPGFLAHGTSDPGRRTDPGAQFDWDLFFTEYKRHMGIDVTPVITPPKPDPKPRKKNSHAHRSYKPGEVKKIQSRLDYAGFDPGPQDDDYGPDTEGAVEDYQRAQRVPDGEPRLVPDGDWGPTTQAHYDWTRELQLALNEWEAVRPKLRIDGDFRSQTSRAVGQAQDGSDNDNKPQAAYRRAGGRVVDNDPGPITCKMLGIRRHP